MLKKSQESELAFVEYFDCSYFSFINFCLDVVIFVVFFFFSQTGLD